MALSGMILVLVLALSVLLAIVTRSSTVSPTQPLKTPRKLVIDTDAGGDDAMALLLALGQEFKHPDLTKVIAVTCVNGNTNVDNVVVNVLKILKTANRLDVPVYRGAPGSLVITPWSINFYGDDGMGDIDFPDPPQPEDYLKPEHAVNALIRLATENPGEVTLLCLGPLTNLALAIRLDPKILSKLKQVIVLGGTVAGYGNMLPGVEFNFYMDPEANYIVLNSTDTTAGDVNPITLVSWDTILDNPITLEWRLEVLGQLNSSWVHLMNRVEQSLLTTGPNWMCADAVAAAVTLAPDLVLTSESQYITAEVKGLIAHGAIFVDYSDNWARPHNVDIVKNVDVDRYRVMLNECLQGPDRSIP